MKNPQKLSVTSHLLYQMNPAEITVWILCVRITFTYCTVGETCWLLFFIVISIAGYEGRVGMAAIVLKQGRTLHGPKLYDHLVETLPAFAWPWFLRIQVCHLLNHSLYFYISLLAHLFSFFFQTSLDVTETFKQQKGKLVQEGFNPEITKDHLYFLDITQKDYLLLNVSLYEDIVNGKIKL